MIAGTTNPFAVHAGLKVLQRGGNAADAALTTSLAQIALSTGAAISYAGILTAVYYDSASGKVYSLNAGYDTVRGENDPLSIPPWGQHSGRTALVPGFIAGVQALHDRFGKRPFAELFGPAIWIADHGVPFSPSVEAWLQESSTFVTRLPEGKRIFTKENGDLYKAGELFRQPELAETLKNVANQGAAYMYTGAWAHRFVAAVQRENGKMTLADLASYEVSWTEPRRISYGDYEVVSLGPGSLGSLVTLGSLKAAEVARLKQYGHYTSSAEALYYLTQILRIEKSLSLMTPEQRGAFLPDIDTSLEAQITATTAKRVVDHIRKNMKEPQLPRGPDVAHSAGVLAVDDQGNVACILHSLNGVLWGTTGIFVDGISIPDSAAFQQQAIAAIGGGARLPNTTNPLIVLKGGKPILASAAIGSALQMVTVENLINILDFGMEPKSAVEQPNTLGPNLGMVTNAPPKPEYEKETFREGEFSESVLDQLRERGQPVKVINDHTQDGYWIGIQLDPAARKLKGATTRKLPSLVEGY